MIGAGRPFLRTAAIGLLSLAYYQSGGVLQGAPIDLSRPPDPEDPASLGRKGRLGEFRNSLGDALASQWRASRNGNRGSSAQENFAKWIDLYQWLDLLESDEAVMTKRWLSTHLSMSSEKSPQGEKIQVTIHQPGSPLVHRYDRLQHQVTERVAADPSMLGRVMGELVAQPFVSRNGPLIGRLEPAFVETTLSDPGFLKLWSESYSEDDFQPKVLLNLQAIWKSSPADWREFTALALAIALVLDQPAPAFWPHHQVPPTDVPRIDPQPAEVFSQWVRASRRGKLRVDPKFLAVRELKFVIDAPLDPGEFDAVRDFPSLSHESPPQFFSSIAYDRGRVAKNVYSWPWGGYRLAKIREHGGICVDQAYYAAISGKALGIPTIFFAGQGKDGGHAWVGYFKGRKSWDLNVGRYAEQNYASGEGLDPQNWAPITDHTIEMLTRHLGNTDPQNAARRDLVMAWNFRRRNNASAEGQALQSARISCPENPLLWNAMEDWLARTGSPVSEIKAHHEAAIRQFGRFRDIKVQHQEALVSLALGSGDATAAERLSGQIVHENRGNRTDISATAAGQLITSRLEANDPEGALQEYDRQLRLQGATGGGDFFYKVTVPFASKFLSNGRPDLARRVLKRAYETLKPTKGEMVDRDFRKLWQQAGGTT